LQVLHITTISQRRLRFWAHNSWCHNPIVGVISTGTWVYRSKPMQ